MVNGLVPRILFMVVILYQIIMNLSNIYTIFFIVDLHIILPQSIRKVDLISKTDLYFYSFYCLIEIEIPSPTS